MPTAISILALERIARRSDNAAVRRRIEQGRAYLLQRRCRDGGWNHGSTRALGYDSDSYPETTGVALLALHASNASDMASAEAVAERHLSACKSTEAGAWLVLGLTARGKRAELPRHESHGTTMEIALTALAESAIEGRNPFLA
jgi:hypothetical protein